MTASHGAASNWAKFRWQAAAVGIACLALALRLWHIRHGLPDFLEEAIPFKEALEMWGWETGSTDLNPHFFNYPSLSIYLHFLIQKAHYALGHLSGQFASPADYWLRYQLDPSSHVIAARLLGIGCDTATVLAAWRIGERIRPRAGIIAALLLALAPVMILTARSIYSDTMMAAASMWALERLLAYHQHGGLRRLGAAVILIGLAVGAKYTAGFLVIPLAWVLWQRHGSRGLKWFPAAGAACVLVFILTSPYILLDFEKFWIDFNFERVHMSEGHLGTLDRTGALFHLQAAGKNLGWPGLILLLIGFLLTLRRVRERSAVTEVALWLFLIPNAVSISFFRMEAARYLLVVLPPAAALVSVTAVRLTQACATRWRATALAAVMVIVVAPVLREGLQAAARGGDSTQLQARRWCEAHLTRDHILVQEPYGATLRDFFSINRIRQHRVFKDANPEARERLEAWPWFRAVTMPSLMSGHYTMTLRSRSGRELSLRVFDNVTDANQIFYEPALYHGVDYVLVSSLMRQRYEADPIRYPAQVRFYRMLDQYAEVAADFIPHGSVAGPHITIYRLGERFRDYLASNYDRLDLFWWARAVSQKYRQEAESLLVSADKRTGGAIYGEDGAPAGWVMSLREPFKRFIEPFLVPMAHHLAELSRFAQGRRYSVAVLVMHPEMTLACLVYSLCCRNLDAHEHALTAVDTALEEQKKRGAQAPVLVLERVELLVALGRPVEANDAYGELLRMVPKDSPLAQRAQRVLMHVESSPTDN